MRLLHAATFAFLGWQTAHAIPPAFLADNPGLVVEKVTPSVQFIDPELQHRSSRFLNQATARESLSVIASLYCTDKNQHLLSMAVPFPTSHGTSAKATLAFCPSQTTRMRKGSSSFGFSQATILSPGKKLYSGVSISSTNMSSRPSLNHNSKRRTWLQLDGRSSHRERAYQLAAWNGRTNAEPLYLAQLDARCLD